MKIEAIIGDKVRMYENVEDVVYLKNGGISFAYSVDGWKQNKKFIVFHGVSYIMTQDK